MTERIPLQTCQRRLAILWIVVGLGLFLLVAAQSILDHYGSRVEDAWNWFLPTVMPTLLLMVGVLSAQSRPASGRRTSSRFLFRLAFALSLVYLSLVAVTLLIEPFATRPIVEILQMSNRWLLPLQGLTNLALGVFFVRGGDETGSAAGESAA